MNLIEALKQANGKPVRRTMWGDKYPLASFYGEGVLLNSVEILADDWYVVEPKSPIEEAIKNLRDDALTYKITTDKKGYDLRDRIDEAMRRIVNLTLDEAKKAKEQWLHDSSTGTLSEAIDALKVKE